ncbi:hypothetical protein F5Y01DRAFT_285781 [Xylaria sp. FL0043]|nr:hypothetical protein F5Y01DRAFT_285781 [Xylaria sp. FL0043]
MATPIIYEDLPDQATSIRLLKIRPGWPLDPIRVELLGIPDRKNAPSYHALSYVWGSQENPVVIQCNGIEIPVTTNLASALRAFRPLPAKGDAEENGIAIIHKSHMLHSSRHVWKDIARNRNEIDYIDARRQGREEEILYWIDALCINQNDMGERAAQVKSMRSIYAQASRVRIWLGDQLVSVNGSALHLPETKASRMNRGLGRVKLAELGHMPVVLAFIVQALRNEALVLKSTRDASHGDILIDEIGFPDGDSPEYQILRAFLDQPWFHRVWIVQEAVLAADSCITVGDWELDWAPFSRAIQVLSHTSLSMGSSLMLRFTGHTLKSETTRLSLLPSLYLHDIKRIPTRTKFLLSLLDDSRGREATNPADHVFAVLGMAVEMVEPTFSSVLPELLTVDYTKPTGHVFRDATWFIILNHHTLRPLIMAEFFKNRPFPECPSWAPVWSQERRAFPLCHEIFDAHYGQILALSPTGKFDTLSAKGYTFEPVRHVIDMQLPDRPQVSGEWHYPPHEEDKAFVSQAWDLASKSMERLREANVDSITNHGAGGLLPSYRHIEDTLPALLYTLVGNANSSTENGRADASDEAIQSGEAWVMIHVDACSSQISGMKRLRYVLKEALYPGIDLTFQTSFLAACTGRRFFTTQNGFFGIGPASIEENDIVAVVMGVSVPIVLREVEDLNSDLKNYIVVGECYVHGIMDGELVKARQDAGREAEMLRFI